MNGKREYRKTGENDAFQITKKESVGHARLS